MPLAIVSVRDVPMFAQIPLDHIISIHDSRQHGPDISGFKHPFTLHSFVFDDTSEVSVALAPSHAAMRRLLSIYATTTPESRMLFHCFAGVSRSTAAAFLWLVYHGASYQDAYAAVVTLRGPFVAPNQLMVRLADDIFMKGGEMYGFLVADLGRREPERQAWFAANQ